MGAEANEQFWRFYVCGLPLRQDALFDLKDRNNYV
jgi:hypothetical protein